MAEMLVKSASRLMMPDPPSSLAVLLLALGISGCGAAIEPPPDGRVPVIQALLIAGDSLQAAWVEWRVPADSTFGPEPRPVDPNLVQVALILPNDSAVPFTPSPNVPGRFEAAAIVVPGTRYRLTGTVAGVTLTAETTVPGALAVFAPAQDTVDGASCVGNLLFLCDLPYSWFSAGAAAYLYLQSENDTSRLRIAGSTRESIGFMRLLQDTGTERLTVLALEQNAASFLTATTPKSSINGVFGLFGAATRAVRWIAWP
jgi:hypothetical protein